MSRWPEYREALNASHLEHTIYAFLMQLPFAMLDHAWAGAAFAIAFFIGREHAQVQVKYNLGDWDAFLLRYWSLDARLDLFCPAVAVVLLAGIIHCGRWLAL